MDNENKNLQDNENELTPEERVQEDISAKIADAATEVQDEIDEANGESFEAEEALEDESWSDEAWEEAPEEVEEVVKAAPISIAKSRFVISLIAAALIGALITVCCFQAPTWIANIPEGNKVASINGEEITDLDISYYIYVEASKYAQKNNISQADFGTYDWDKEVDGVKLSDKIKKDALDSALTELAVIKKGAENGITLGEDKIMGLDSQIAGITATYGEEGFILRARTMGMPSIKQYAKMFKRATTYQAVQEDVSKNPDKYYPEDRSVLNEHIGNEKVSVQHILIKVEDEAKDEEMRNKAQSILDRANNGEDFTALMSEFNEDKGEPDEGYTFGKGEMDAAFEEAAFALKENEISGLVRSSYGYHIIKKLPAKAGEDELYKYLKAQEAKKTKINENKLAKISVKDIMKDVANAADAVSKEEKSAQTAK